MIGLLLATLLVAAGPALAAEHPHLVLTGRITAADHQHYREVPFDVPAGVDRITVKVQYDKANKTVVDMGVLDPARFRGWSGGARDRFTISASDATPGYLPGAIPPGRWRMLLGVPNARRNADSAYSIEIFFDHGASRAASAAIADPLLKAQPGWYRGDLHMHTGNSDGTCLSQQGRRVPCPVFRTVEAAAAAGLDFIAVTDHNTVAHFDDLRALQPWFDRLLLIPGVEVTTFQGHANLFGPAGFVDFRLGTADVPDAAALASEAAAAGALMSINHPALPSGERCMGCGWSAKRTNYDAIQAIEAINGTIAEGPLAGLGFWYARLNEGHHLTGIGGSDSHDPDAPDGKPPIGRPTTVVHAAELSQKGILDGIRAGNVFIDVEGTRNRMLELEATSGSGRSAMGGTLKPDGPVRFRAHVANVGGATLEIVANGKVIDKLRRPVTGSDMVVTGDLPDTSACGWIAANVRSEAGHLLLVGNPIYLARRSHQAAC